jgi:hypothetical protein
MLLMKKEMRTRIGLFWLLVLSLVTPSMSISMPRPVVMAASTKKVHPSLTGPNYKESIERDIRRIIQGMKGFFALLSEAGKVDKKRKEGGLSSLSFTEYSLLATKNEDISKLLRILIYIPLSPELFFYSSVLIPFIGLNKNPWIWQAFPSTFSYADELQSRREILNKRRIQLVVNSLSWLKNNVIDDVNDAYRRFVVGEDIERIEKAMSQSSSTIASLQTLEPLYLASDPASINKLIKKKKLDADLAGFPAWSVVKEMCRSIGTDGLPNIVFLRRFNRGEIVKYVNKIRKDDEFIDQIGVKALNNHEVRSSRCFIDANANADCLHVVAASLP